MMDPTQNRGWLAMDKMYMAIRNSQQARKHHKLPSYIVAYDLGPCTRQENFLSGREMLSNEQQILVRHHKHAGHAPLQIAVLEFLVIPRGLFHMPSQPELYLGSGHIQQFLIILPSC